MCSSLNHLMMYWNYPPSHICSITYIYSLFYPYAML